MRVVEIGLAIVVAFLLQTLGGRYGWPLGRYVDLFLVVTAGFALTRGRTVGMVTGTMAGLVQDSFSGALLGLNGLSKTTVGYLSGILGRWLIVRGFAARVLFFFAASAVDLLIVGVLGYAVERPIVTTASLAPLVVCAVNGLVGAVVLMVAERLRWRRNHELL